MTSAAGQLTRALITMATQGQLTRCGHPADQHLWISDHPDERALAATLCNGCPVHAECADAAEANGEKFGVWAGVNRTQPTQPPGSKPPRLNAAKVQHKVPTRPAPGVGSDRESCAD